MCYLVCAGKEQVDSFMPLSELLRPCHSYCEIIYVRGVCSRRVCDYGYRALESLQTKDEDAVKFGTTRSYWLHRQSVLYDRFSKLLEETGRKSQHVITPH